VIADVHGNLPALEAVLAELDREPVDVLVCAGDVLWGPLQAECLALLAERGARCVTGNNEREVLAGSEQRTRWSAARLGEAERAQVRGWPATLALDVPPLGRVLVCHSVPASDELLISETTPDAVLGAALAGTEAELVVAGHTHHQFDRTVAGIRYLNAGAVGLPYEGDAAAFWLLLDGEPQFRRTAYDVPAAVRRMRATAMPELAEMLGDSLIAPIPRAEAIAEFEALRLRAAGG
jgi:predicted phosphodiesterase